MEAYTTFAKVYDELMDNIPYDKWCEYIIGLLKEYGISQGIVAELGCGTGNVTEFLAASGYDMIGIDNSAEMLEIANNKKAAHSLKDILYLLQDMREFELYGTVAAVICVCDSLNYILDSEQLIQVFKLVNNYLDPKGIFIFDFNTRHYYRDIVAQSTIAEDRDDVSFIWDNFYDEDENINELNLSLFIRQKDSPDLYRKYLESHYQAGYTIEEITACVESSGLKLLAVYDAFTHSPATKDSERVYVIAQEQGK
jgi:SAM-dependent methyltransferase